MTLLDRLRLSIRHIQGRLIESKLPVRESKSRISYDSPRLQKVLPETQSLMQALPAGL